MIIYKEIICVNIWRLFLNFYTKALFLVWFCFDLTILLLIENTHAILSMHQHFVVFYLFIFVTFLFISLYACSFLLHFVCSLCVLFDTQNAVVLIFVMICCVFKFYLQNFKWFKLPFYCQFVDQKFATCLYPSAKLQLIVYSDMIQNSTTSFQLTSQNKLLTCCLLPNS